MTIFVVHPIFWHKMRVICADVSSGFNLEITSSSRRSRRSNVLVGAHDANAAPALAPAPARGVHGDHASPVLEDYPPRVDHSLAYFPGTPVHLLLPPVHSPQSNLEKWKKINYEQWTILWTMNYIMDYTMNCTMIKKHFHVPKSWEWKGRVENWVVHLCSSLIPYQRWSQVEITYWTVRERQGWATGVWPFFSGCEKGGKIVWMRREKIGRDFLVLVVFWRLFFLLTTEWRGLIYRSEWDGVLLF